MPHFEHEILLRSQGFRAICGIDEAGRGPLAGPVVAAVCYFEEQIELPLLDDSKKLSAKVREALFHELLAHPHIHIATAEVSHEVIDDINILQATLLAMRGAFEKLENIDYALIDGNRSPELPVPSLPIIKGDNISYSIAAASIAAKVTRDRLMRAYDEKWPEYGFAKHMGYGTRLHLEAIAKYGPCPIHRFSFAPLKGLVLNCSISV